jgi:hypothetical protein
VSYRGREFSQRRNTSDVHEFCLRLLQRLFGLLAARNIAVNFQNPKRVLLLIAQQRPPACHNYLSFICLDVYELAFPVAGTQQVRFDLLYWRREDGLQEFVSGEPADYFFRRPPV